MKRTSPGTRCHDCGVEEGRLHKPGCDMERCPFCGRQLISCGCALRHFYPDTYSELPPDHPNRPPFAGLPENVYENGLSREQAEEWERLLERKGLVPWICYPNMCCRCGALWPDMFAVADEEWDRYIEPAMRGRMLCRSCFDWIKAKIDAGSQVVQITPLGAAVVEALPDQKKVARIKRAFREQRVCPASKLFTQEQADAWAKSVPKDSS